MTVPPSSRLSCAALITRVGRSVPCPRSLVASSRWESRPIARSAACVPGCGVRKIVGISASFAYGSATRRSRPSFVHHVLGVRHAKLTIAGEWKSHPAKAVAGGSEPSLAGVAVTRGLKRRQGSYGMWERASKGGRSRRPSLFPVSEGSTCRLVMREAVASPESMATSRTEGSRRNMRGPTGAAALVRSGERERGIAGVVARAEVGSRTHPSYR